ncbi:MAG: hypothetical protein LBG12_10145 [Synergistaceae bacterium]|nr:hypothetical protein [Synergistaceae bacterium]
MPVNNKVVLCGRYPTAESRVIIPHPTVHDSRDEEIANMQPESAAVPRRERAKNERDYILEG